MTLATVWSTANTIGVDLTAIWSSASQTGTFNQNVQPYPPFAAGTKLAMLNGGMATYIKLSTGGATGLGYVLVAPLGDLTAAVMMSNSVGNLGDPVGVWLGNGAAISGDYGWMQTSGLCAAMQVAASCVRNVALASTTTAGVLDDAVGSLTKNISNVWATVTVTTAAATPADLNNGTVGSTN